jgi:hypothetical protein
MRPAPGAELICPSVAPICDRNVTLKPVRLTLQIFLYKLYILFKKERIHHDNRKSKNRKASSNSRSSKSSGKSACQDAAQGSRETGRKSSREASR